MMKHRPDHKHVHAETGSRRRALGLLVFTLFFIQACAGGATEKATATASVLPTQALAASQTMLPSQTLQPASTGTLAPTLEPTTGSTAPSTIAATLAVTTTPGSTAVPSPQEPVLFAVIGDYGSGKEVEGDVAKQVISWNPDFIITVGDNNYPKGTADFIDKAIGQFYHSYIYPYQGQYGKGADMNRFFPCLGNHDLDTNNGQAYYDYFQLPGNERYYDFVWGPVHFFALNSMYSEPDGATKESRQAQWLKDGLAKSTSAWNVVYFHYSPYTSGHDGPVDSIRWPFKDWGADIVFSGHDHDYERLNIGGLTYVVNGLGGGDLYAFKSTVSGSEVRFDKDWGAIKVNASESKFKLEFITRTGEVIDTYEMSK